MKFHSNYLDFKFGFLGCGSQDQKRSASNPALRSANRVVFELKQLCVVVSDLRTRYEGSGYQVQCCAWDLNRCKERGMGRSEKENLAEEL